MSSPKAKAKELFKKYSKGKDEHGWSLCEFDSCAKQCALIAVDEILNSSPSLPILGDGGYLYEDIELSKNYWQEVKQELEKL